MLERLVTFLEEYQSRVKEVYALFRKHRGLKTPAHGRMFGLEQRGFIDNENTIEYYFHGKGCLVKLPSGEVDWDFTSDSSVGLSIGFLHSFARRGTENYPEFRDFETLNKVFQEAISKGILQKHPKEPSEYTFFLKSDLT